MSLTGNSQLRNFRESKGYSRAHFLFSSPRFLYHENSYSFFFFLVSTVPELELLSLQIVLQKCQLKDLLHRLCSIMVSHVCHEVEPRLVGKA